MATFTLAANQKWDDSAFSTRAGKDSYYLGAYTLTIDTDSRYCANASAITGNLGTLNVNTGKLLVDGTAVRLIPYNSGSGNVPAYGTSISQGGVSGPLLGVWSALNTAPTAAGAAMPASGYIKVRSVSGGSFAAGALTGIGASATGADVVGWIEIAGCEGQTINYDGSGTGGIGSIVMSGAWFAVGTTPATPATTDTYQLPASEGVAYYAGVEVETGNGTGVYEWWPAVNGLTKNQFATDERGRVCWINSAGVLRFGDDGLGVSVTAWVTATSYAIGDQRSNGGTVYYCLVAHTSGTFATDLAAAKWASATVGGMLPAANARIRVGNILLSQAASSSPYGNVAPNATVNTRYRNSGSGTTLTMDKVSCGWRFASTSGFLLSVSNITMLEFFSVIGSMNATQIDGLCIGLSGSAIAASDSQFNITGNVGSLSVNNVVATKYVEANTGPVYLNTVYSGTISNVKSIVAKNRGGNYYAIYVDTVENVTFNNMTAIGAPIVSAGTRCTWNNTKYADALCGPVQTINAASVFAAAGEDVVIDGVSWVTSTPNTCHPYQAILTLDRRFKTKLRNIGSYASPLNMGTVNQSNGLILSNGSQLAKIAKIDRCYLTAVRTGLVASGGTSTIGVNWLISDCSVASGSQAVYPIINGAARGCMGVIASTFVVGGHVFALYQSTSAGTLGFKCAKPLTDEPSASTLTASNGVIFTAQTAYMPAVDDRVTFKCPFKVRGYTAFSGAPTFSAGTIGNFLVEYSLDKGATWKTASSGNLTGETLPDPAVGFDFWCRATTVTPGNTTANGVGTISFPMTTTAGAQANQYALEEVTFTDSRSDGISDASVAWVAPGGASLFGFYTGTGSTAIYQNEDGTAKTGTYISRRAGYNEFVGGWSESSSWYQDTKVYFISQTIAEAVVTTTNDATFTIVGDTSVTLGASKTLKNLYDQSQYWSCLEANMLYDIPVVSAGGGAYTANVDVIATGYTLNGAGSLAMGAHTLTGSIPFSYTYTGGTWSQASTVPSFSGGTLSLPTAGTYTFGMSSAGVKFGAASTAWDLSACTFSGTIALTTSTGSLAVTVAIPSGVSYTTEGANITVTAPVISASVSVTGMPNIGAVPTRLQLTNTTALTAAARANSTAYSLGDIRLRQTGIGTENTAGLYLRCTTAGTSAGTPPTWNTTPGGTTTDGTVVWTTYKVLFYDADPAGTSYTDTYIDGEEFLAGETIEIRFAEEDPGITFKTYSTSVVATANGFSALVNETADDVYATYALSGAAYEATFSPNYVANYIVLDANTDFSGKAAYAYYCYLLTTSSGMYRFWGGLTGIDAGNIRNNVGTISLYFDESAGFVKQTDDVRIFRSDNTRPAIDPTTGGSGIEINWRTPVSVVTTSDQSLNLATAEQAIDNKLSSISSGVWAYVVTGSTTAVQMMRGFAAMLLGKVSGAGTGAETFRDIADTKDVATFTVDSSGNRTAVTRDLT